MMVRISTKNNTLVATGSGKLAEVVDSTHTRAWF